MERNPFITNGYAGEEYFCDRIEETKYIVSMLTNQNNMALISPRRLGKTDLLRHCFSQPEIKDNYYTFEIDIYSTSSIQDFVDVLGKAIINTLRPLGQKAWEKFLQMLSSLRSEISFDINGLPVWGLGLGTITNPTTTLHEIFDYLQNADKPCLVAIDEFQQILKYPDGDKIEALLRSHVQRCNNANFIFSGSQRHIMSGIFLTPNRPFYQSVIPMELKPIEYSKYEEFCVNNFRKYNKHLDTNTVYYVYQRYEGITMYMQSLMNILFNKTPCEGYCTKEMVDDAIDTLLSYQSSIYETILNLMPEKQRRLFLAIAQERKARSISSGHFVRKYRLISPSSVLSALKGLMDKDFITQNNDTYYVYDFFFVEWLRKKEYIM